MELTKEDRAQLVPGTVLWILREWNNDGEKYVTFYATQEEAIANAGDMYYTVTRGVKK